jgi:dihydrofolate reductase
LIAYDLVDEYRLIVFPLVLGEGERMFPDGTAPANLALVSARPSGSATPGQKTSNGGRQAPSS